MPKRDLPTEVYFKIFRLLDRETVRNCLCVYKHWQAAAFETYYQSITLEADNIYLDKQILSIGVQVQQHQYFKYGKFTKTLKIHKDTMDDLKGALVEQRE
jgi:hypothetical protein